ncbi:hypothetical protein FRC07_006061, partial [Ceratobasidium sp. 392]
TTAAELNAAERAEAERRRRSHHRYYDDPDDDDGYVSPSYYRDRYDDRDREPFTPPCRHALSPPQRTPSKRIILAVTHDAENYVVVAITSHMDAQAIRERILSKLHIPDDLHPSFAIYRTELGGFAIGGALDNNQLLIECEHFGDDRGSLKFLAQSADAPTDDLDVPLMPVSKAPVPPMLSSFSKFSPGTMRRPSKSRNLQMPTAPVAPPMSRDLWMPTAPVIEKPSFPLPAVEATESVVLAETEPQTVSRDAGVHRPATDERGPGQTAPAQVEGAPIQVEHALAQVEEDSSISPLANSGLRSPLSNDSSSERAQGLAQSRAPSPSTTRLQQIVPSDLTVSERLAQSSAPWLSYFFWSGSSFNPSLASSAGGRDAAPFRITFPLNLDWYRKQSCTRFNSIQHRKERGGLAHEFIILELEDDSICRMERMGDPSARVEAISPQGTSAYDIIQWFPSCDSPGARLEDTDTVAIIKFPDFFDLMDVLRICRAIHEGENTCNYTLQGFNCYFFALAIQVILTALVRNREKALSKALWCLGVGDGLSTLSRIYGPSSSPQGEWPFILRLFSLLGLEKLWPAEIILRNLQ